MNTGVCCILYLCSVSIHPPLTTVYKEHGIHKENHRLFCHEDRFFSLQEAVLSLTLAQVCLLQGINTNDIPQASTIFPIAIVFLLGWDQWRQQLEGAPAAQAA